jgi:O-antigen ligase
LGRLPTLGSVSILLVVGILLAHGDWQGAGKFAIIAFVLFSTLAAPQTLDFIAMLAFLSAAMPFFNAAGTVNSYRWAVLVIFALGLILRNSMGVSGSRWHPFQFSLGLFVCWALISSTYSVNSLLTILKAGAFGCLLLGSLLNGRLESHAGPEAPCKIIDHLFWCALLVGAGCVLAFVGILPRGWWNYFEGPFGNPNFLAAFIPFIAPVLVLRLFQSAKKAPLVRVLNFAFAAMFLAFLVMSGSRTGMIATFVGCAWFLYFSSRKAFGWFVTVGFLAAVILVAYFPAFLGSLNQTYVEKGGSRVLQSRQKLLEDSWAAATESPILGVGFGATKGASEDWQFSFASVGSGREKVNSFLGLVEEVGLVGAALLLYPLTWIVLNSVRRLELIQKFHSAGGEFWPVLTLSACLVGGLTDSMAEGWLTATGMFAAVMFWLIYGVLSARLLMPFRALEREMAAGR